MMLGGCGIIETLRSDDEFMLRRGRRNSDGAPVLILTVVSAHPTAAVLARLNNEYELRAELDSSWAAQPLELINSEKEKSLVLTDSGGGLLENLLGQRLELQLFLRLAIGISMAIDQLHQHDIVHKDLNPANILIDLSTGEARLSGFGLASRIPREHQALVPLEIIAGTFAYMAPEQTGRMNRSVDSRSDLYSMGIIFYQMLTGVLPFTASDPMEWVHCHIAHQAIAPSKRWPDVPDVLSNIIMKLLEKTAEERYQTAAGVTADLRHCLDQWTSQGEVASFSLGGGDISGQLLIPEKLYGRDEQRQILINAVDQVVSSGTPEMVMISGYSGIGKSSLVNELHPAIMLPRAIYISGKFDQHKRNIPYATLAQAFQPLIRQILTRNEEELDVWRTTIQQAVGSNGQLIVDLIPELKFIIGEQTRIIEFAPTEAQHRFQMAFCQFFNIFADAEHPLILFLDDLQWVDVASLKLIEYLVTHSPVRHFLLIGGYRNNEVGLAHPLMLTLDVVRKSGLVIHDIVLEPLTQKDVEQLIADSILCDNVSTLAELVFDKTGGNPFFTIQFLNKLAEERLLTFNQDDARWTWDLDRIHAKAFSNNVVDLMIAKLQRLPDATLDVLKLLACLGNNAQVGTIAMVYGKSEEMAQQDLRPALHISLLIRHTGSYRFQHDRIQEAAYSLIAPDILPDIHLKIGRLALSGLTPAAIDEQLFDIVNHLNHGLARITDAMERKKLYQLNVLAGQRAKDAVAYASARHYLTQAAGLLPTNAWNTSYDDTYKLFLALSECEYLTTNFERADEIFNVILDHASSNLDRARVHILQATLYQISGHFGKAVSVSVNAFKMVGIDMPDTDAEIQIALETEKSIVDANLNGRSIADLVNSPQPSDPEMRMVLDIFSIAITSLYIANPFLSLFFTVKALNISLLHGNTEASCSAFSGYAVMLVSMGEISKALKFSEMSLRLNEKFNDSTRKGRLMFFHGAFINFWSRPFRKTIPILEQAFVTCLDGGDFPFAAYSSSHILTQVLENGDPLEEVLTVAQKYLAFSRKSRNEIVTLMHQVKVQVAECMMGLTIQEGSLDSHTFSASETLDIFIKADFGTGIASFFVMKQIVAFTYGKYSDALVSANQVASKLGFIRSTANEEAHHFYHALTLAALHSTVTASQQKEFLQILLEKQTKLKLWSENCPENFQSRYALVSAELARIECRNLDAMRLYDEAIESARINGFVQVEGIANELAARFYLAADFERIAHVYIREARYCFNKWGAMGKVKQLDRDFPTFDARVSNIAANSAGISVAHLDMLSVIRASQAVSGVIVLEALIKTLLRIVIENAGADRGLLMLPQKDIYFIEAEGKIEQNGVQVTAMHVQASAKQLPESILKYVIRTREEILLADAITPSQFSEDTYVREFHPKSVLCLPLMKQGKLVGILYLENKLAPNVFTPDRVAILDLLASQAAISLENATLFSNLEKENIERKRAERALEEYRDQLELTIKERTRELVGQNLKLEDAYRSLEEISLTDQLTGLRNRRFLMQNLEPDIAMCLRRYDEWLKAGSSAVEPNMDIVFFMVDLDHFKMVNDQYGHAAGDSVLLQIRERLQLVFRTSDYLIRWGGEEFLVVARATDREAAPDVAERLRLAFSSRDFMLAGDLSLTKTCSVGFACFPFFRAHPRLLSWSQVVELADQGLYRAKHCGRNGWVGSLGGECKQAEGVFERLMHSTDQAISDGELQPVESDNIRSKC